MVFISLLEMVTGKVKCANHLSRRWRKTEDDIMENILVQCLWKGGVSGPQTNINGG